MKTFKNLLALGFFAFFVLAFSLPAFSEVTMVYPVKATAQSGSSIQAGSIAPGQELELIFSDNSGYGFEWSNLELDSSSFPSEWKIVSKNMTDSSLGVKVLIPEGTQANYYNLGVVFSNSENSITEEITSVVIVKENLLDVSFSKQSPKDFSVVGENVPYVVTVSNSSVAPYFLRISSNLPSNWFDERVIEAKPNSVQDVVLDVNPKTYGQRSFSLAATIVPKNKIVKTFSSDLKVRPTLKGKFAASFSGFPFFSFSLLPFEMAASFLADVLPL